MLSRRNLLIVASLAVIILGFVLITPPKPPITISAEPILDLGGYTVTNTILSFWVIMILMGAGTLLLYRRLRNMDAAMVPRGAQNLVEALLEQFSNVVVVVAGEKNGHRFFPVIATIFVVLLFANWFGLFPWNNVIGKIVDERVEYLEHLEEDAEDLLAGLGAGLVSPALVQNAFATSYFDPIPLEAGEQDAANNIIAGILPTGQPSARAQAVRAAFRNDPIPGDTAPADLAGAIEHRLERVLADHPFTAAERERIHAGDADEGLEKAAVFNLPLPSAEVEETELETAVVNSGGLNLIPLRADDFEYDPYTEPVILPAAPGSPLRLFDSTAPVDDENRPARAGELRPPVTVNIAHLGIVLKRIDEGLDDDEGIGEVFPFFRSIATDLNLPLAIALWAFIFVQFWSVRSLGVRTNFGKYIGVGSATVVKGPIAVMVGLLEVISEVARIVSFTFRLFGNIFAGELLLFITAFLVPLLAATVFYGLEVFVGFIQAFVFAMLTLVFAVTAVAHGEHAEEELGEETAGH